MMRVATVLSPRDWEPGLVAHAQRTGAISLTQRLYLPEELDPLLVDVVVAGAETAWVTAAQIASWKRAGIAVVGVHPAGDMPAARLLEVGGADEVIADTASPEAIVQTIRFLAPQTPIDGDGLGEVVAVAGHRGAPGTTEIALALSWQWSSSRRLLLIDCDLDGPAVAVRLGVSPRPDLTDAADRVRELGVLPDDVVHRWHAFDAVVGSHRPRERTLRLELVEDVIEAARQRYEVIVVDCGPGDADRILSRADHAVLVTDASAVGLVRAADRVERWVGPPPALIVNRVDQQNADDIGRACRRWTGLEPAALIPLDRRIMRRSRRATVPARHLTREISRLAVPG